MENIIWANNMSMGIASIDSQHKILIKITNELNDAVNNGTDKQIVSTIFTSLFIYTRKHFAYEEDLFKQYHYTDILAHTKEHDILLEKLNLLKTKMLTADKIISKEIISFLREWLTNHIMKTDMNYSHFLKSKGVS